MNDGPFDRPAPVVLSASERRVLEQVYSRGAGHVSQRALASLVARGLVQDAGGALAVTPSGMRALQT
jgi:ribosomal protein S19E (S16A)